MARQFDDLKLGSIELFCLTAQWQSFTAAAQAAGLTAAAVSRSVARMEARLGVRLFQRTTRQVRLTDAGKRYYEQCRQALGQLAEAERELSGQQQSPAGLVRFSLPTSYGHCRILPLLPAFAQAYPDVELVARKLEDAALVVVAAPAYLARCGTPHAIADLAAHECIQFVLPSSGQAVPWILRDAAGRDVEVPTQGHLRCADDILGPVTLARAGAGLLQTYRFIVEADLHSGALREVLPAHTGASRPFSLLYPANRHMPLRVRVLVDFLVDRLARA